MLQRAGDVYDIAWLINNIYCVSEFFVDGWR